VPYEEARDIIERAQVAFRGVTMRDIRDAVDDTPRY
jgi:hypothetical protein